MYALIIIILVLVILFILPGNSEGRGDRITRNPPPPVDVRRPDPSLPPPHIAEMTTRVRTMYYKKAKDKKET